MFLAYAERIPGDLNKVQFSLAFDLRQFEARLANRVLCMEARMGIEGIRVFADRRIKN
jgi:hypothetical protein